MLENYALVHIGALSIFICSGIAYIIMEYNNYIHIHGIQNYWTIKHGCKCSLNLHLFRDCIYNYGIQ